MKLKINLAETYLIKIAMESYVEADEETEINRKVAQDILNKLNK